MRTISPVGLAIIAASIGLTAGSAFAASDVQKACAGKYQAAKAGGTLNGMTYNQYYKQCAADAKAQPAATTAPATPSAAPTTTTAATPAETKAEKKAEKKQEREEKKAEKAAEKKTVAPAATPAAAPAPTPAPAPAPTTTAAKPMPAAPAAAGSAVFPTALSAEFSKESAGTARMHTCLAQYKINKTNNGNGGLRWIEKGGGYYSECNKRLKG